MSGLALRHKDLRRRSPGLKEEWRGRLSATDRHLHMLEHGIDTDCTFVVGPEEDETQEFKAHRFLLCNASAVFEKMLTGEMVEAKTGLIRITDLSPNTFKLLLRFIYADEAKMATFDEACDVAYAADKYLMKKLFHECLSSMCKFLSAENVWKALKFTKLLPHDLLREKCIKIFQTDTADCLTHRDFTHADEEDVGLLLKQDELNVTDELILVDAALYWAEHELKRRGMKVNAEGVRAVLKPRLMSLLRLLTVPTSEIVTGSLFSDWLTAREKCQLMTCRHVKNGSLLPTHLSASMTPRKAATSVVTTRYYCRRTAAGGAKQIYTGFESDFVSSLIFRVKTGCLLLGVHFPTQLIAHDPTNFSNKAQTYTESIDLQVHSYGHSLLKSEVRAKRSELCKIEFTGRVVYNSSMTVMFPHPIPINADNWFKISATFKKCGSYPKAKLATNVVSNGVEFIFHIEQWQNCKYSKNDGLYKALIFSR